MVELREQLRRRRLVTRGAKAELVGRLREELGLEAAAYDAASRRAAALRQAPMASTRGGMPSSRTPLVDSGNLAGSAQAAVIAKPRPPLRQPNVVVRVRPLAESGGHSDEREGVYRRLASWDNGVIVLEDEVPIPSTRGVKPGTVCPYLWGCLLPVLHAPQDSYADSSAPLLELPTAHASRSSGLTR